MKRKLQFVSPRVTKSVPLYLETDMMQVVTGSVMYDLDAVSAGQMTKSITEGVEGDGGYESYWE